MRVNAKRMLVLVEDAGYEPRGYSGRFMFGLECLGVSLERDTTPMAFFADLLEQVAAVGELEDQLAELSFMMRETRTDQLGLGTIVYWPEIEFVGRETGEQDRS